jgi:predicted nucleotidyltransferase
MVGLIVQWLGGDRVVQNQLARVMDLERMRTRQQEGLLVARRCAEILKCDFGVERVVLFGSLLQAERMWWGSDIDLAVWGLAKSDLFKAGAALERGHDFLIDLVPVSGVKPHILDAIKEGVEL